MDDGARSGCWVLISHTVREGLVGNNTQLARLRGSKNITEMRSKLQWEADASQSQPVVGIAHVEDLVQLPNTVVP